MLDSFVLLALSLTLLSVGFGLGAPINQYDELREKIRNDERRLNADLDALRALAAKESAAIGSRGRHYGWNPRPTTQPPYYRWNPRPTTQRPNYGWNPRPTTQPPYYRWNPRPTTQPPYYRWNPRPTTQPPYYWPYRNNAAENGASGPRILPNRKHWNENRIQTGPPTKASPLNNRVYNFPLNSGVQIRSNAARVIVSQRITTSNHNSNIFVHHICNKQGVCVRYYTAGFYSSVSVGGLLLLMLFVCVVVVAYRKRPTSGQYAVLSDTDSQHLTSARVGPLPGQGLSVQSDPVIIGGRV